MKSGLKRNWMGRVRWEPRMTATVTVTTPSAPSAPSA